MLKEALIVVGTPVIRSIVGWAVNALEDGKIESFEVKRLFATVLSVGLPTVALYYGLNALGIDLSAVGAAAGGLLFDMVVRAIKSKKS